MSKAVASSKAVKGKPVVEETPADVSLPNFDEYREYEPLYTVPQYLPLQSNTELISELYKFEECTPVPMHPVWSEVDINNLLMACATMTADDARKLLFPSHLYDTDQAPDCLKSVPLADALPILAMGSSEYAYSDSKAPPHAVLVQSDPDFQALSLLQTISTYGSTIYNSNMSKATKNMQGTDKSAPTSGKAGAAAVKSKGTSNANVKSPQSASIANNSVSLNGNVLSDVSNPVLEYKSIDSVVEASNISVNRYYVCDLTYTKSRHRVNLSGSDVMCELPYDGMTNPLPPNMTKQAISVHLSSSRRFSRGEVDDDGTDDDNASSSSENSSESVFTHIPFDLYDVPEWLFDCLRTFTSALNVMLTPSFSNVHPENLHLWENIIPVQFLASEGVSTPSVRVYLVRVFFAGQWRVVSVDDTVPVTPNGFLLTPVSLPLMNTGTSLAYPIFELWPMLLWKAWLQLYSLSNAYSMTRKEILDNLNGGSVSSRSLLNSIPRPPLLSQIISDSSDISLVFHTFGGWSAVGRYSGIGTSLYSDSVEVLSPSFPLTVCSTTPNPKDVEALEKERKRQESEISSLLLQIPQNIPSVGEITKAKAEAELNLGKAWVKLIENVETELHNAIEVEKQEELGSSENNFLLVSGTSGTARVGLPLSFSSRSVQTSGVSVSEKVEHDSSLLTTKPKRNLRSLVVDTLISQLSRPLLPLPEAPSASTALCVLSLPLDLQGSSLQLQEPAKTPGSATLLSSPGRNSSSSSVSGGSSDSQSLPLGAVHPVILDVKDPDTYFSKNLKKTKSEGKINSSTNQQSRNTNPHSTGNATKTPQRSRKRLIFGESYVVSSLRTGKLHTEVIPVGAPSASVGCSIASQLLQAAGIPLPTASSTAVPIANGSITPTNHGLQSPLNPLVPGSDQPSRLASLLETPLTQSVHFSQSELHFSLAQSDEFTNESETPEPLVLLSGVFAVEELRKYSTNSYSAPRYSYSGTGKALRSVLEAESKFVSEEALARLTFALYNALQSVPEDVSTSSVAATTSAPAVNSSNDVGLVKSVAAAPLLRAATSNQLHIGVPSSSTAPSVTRSPVLNALAAVLQLDEDETRIAQLHELLEHFPFFSNTTDSHVTPPVVDLGSPWLASAFAAAALQPLAERRTPSFQLAETEVWIPLSQLVNIITGRANPQTSQSPQTVNGVSFNPSTSNSGFGSVSSTNNHERGNRPGLPPLANPSSHRTTPKSGASLFLVRNLLNGRATILGQGANFSLSSLHFGPGGVLMPGSSLSQSTTQLHPHLLALSAQHHSGLLTPSGGSSSFFSYHLGLGTILNPHALVPASIVQNSLPHSHSLHQQFGTPRLSSSLSNSRMRFFAESGSRRNSKSTNVESTVAEPTAPTSNIITLHSHWHQLLDNDVFVPPLDIVQSSVGPRRSPHFNPAAAAFAGDGGEVLTTDHYFTPTPALFRLAAQLTGAKSPFLPLIPVPLLEITPARDIKSEKEKRKSKSESTPQPQATQSVQTKASLRSATSAGISLGSAAFSGKLPLVRLPPVFGNLLKSSDSSVSSSSVSQSISVTNPSENIIFDASASLSSTFDASNGKLTITTTTTTTTTINTHQLADNSRLSSTSFPKGDSPNTAVVTKSTASRARPFVLPRAHGHSRKVLLCSNPNGDESSKSAKFLLTVWQDVPDLTGLQQASEQLTGLQKQLTFENQMRRDLLSTSNSTSNNPPGTTGSAPRDGKSARATGVPNSNLQPSVNPVAKDIPLHSRMGNLTLVPGLTSINTKNAPILRLSGNKPLSPIIESYLSTPNEQDDVVGIDTPLGSYHATSSSSPVSQASDNPAFLEGQRKNKPSQTLSAVDTGREDSRIYQLEQLEQKLQAEPRPLQVVISESNTLDALVPVSVHPSSQGLQGAGSMHSGCNAENTLQPFMIATSSSLQPSMPQSPLYTSSPSVRCLQAARTASSRLCSFVLEVDFDYVGSIAAEAAFSRHGSRDDIVVQIDGVDELDVKSELSPTREDGLPKPSFPGGQLRKDVKPLFVDLKDLGSLGGCLMFSPLAEPTPELSVPGTTFFTRGSNRLLQLLKDESVLAAIIPSTPVIAPPENIEPKQKTSASAPSQKSSKNTEKDAVPAPASPNNTAVVPFVPRRISVPEQFMSIPKNSYSNMHNNPAAASFTPSVSPAVASNSNQTLNSTQRPGSSQGPSAAAAAAISTKNRSDALGQSALSLATAPTSNPLEDTTLSSDAHSQSLQQSPFISEVEGLSLGPVASTLAAHPILRSQFTVFTGVSTPGTLVPASASPASQQGPGTPNFSPNPSSPLFVSEGTSQFMLPQRLSVLFRQVLDAAYFATTDPVYSQALQRLHKHYCTQLQALQQPKEKEKEKEKLQKEKEEKKLKEKVSHSRGHSHSPEKDLKEKEKEKEKGREKEPQPRIRLGLSSRYTIQSSFFFDSTDLDTLAGVRLEVDHCRNGVYTGSWNPPFADLSIDDELVSTTSLDRASGEKVGRRNSSRVIRGLSRSNSSSISSPGSLHITAPQSPPIGVSSSSNFSSISPGGDHSGSKHPLITESVPPGECRSHVLVPVLRVYGVGVRFELESQSTSNSSSRSSNPTPLGGLDSSSNNSALERSGSRSSTHHQSALLHSASISSTISTNQSLYRDFGNSSASANRSSIDVGQPFHATAGSGSVESVQNAGRRQIKKYEVLEAEVPLFAISDWLSLLRGLNAEYGEVNELFSFGAGADMNVPLSLEQLLEQIPVDENDELLASLLSSSSQPSLSVTIPQKSSDPTPSDTSISLPPPLQYEQFVKKMDLVAAAVSVSVPSSVAGGAWSLSFSSLPSLSFQPSVNQTSLLIVDANSGSTAAQPQPQMVSSNSKTTLFSSAGAFSLETNRCLAPPGSLLLAPSTNVGLRDLGQANGLDFVLETDFSGLPLRVASAAEEQAIQAMGLGMGGSSRKGSSQALTQRSLSATSDFGPSTSFRFSPVIPPAVVTSSLAGPVPAAAAGNASHRSMERSNSFVSVSSLNSLNSAILAPTYSHSSSTSRPANVMGVQSWNSNVSSQSVPVTSVNDSSSEMLLKYELLQPRSLPNGVDLVVSPFLIDNSVKLYQLFKARLSSSRTTSTGITTIENKRLPHLSVFAAPSLFVYPNNASLLPVPLLPSLSHPLLPAPRLSDFQSSILADIADTSNSSTVISSEKENQGNNHSGYAVFMASGELAELPQQNSIRAATQLFSLCMALPSTLGGAPGAHHPLLPSASLSNPADISLEVHLMALLPRSHALLQARLQFARALLRAAVHAKHDYLATASASGSSKPLGQSAQLNQSAPSSGRKKSAASTPLSPSESVSRTSSVANMNAVALQFVDMCFQFLPGIVELFESRIRRLSKLLRTAQALCTAAEMTVGLTATNGQSVGTFSGHGGSVRLRRLPSLVQIPSNGVEPTSQAQLVRFPHNPYGSGQSAYPVSVPMADLLYNQTFSSIKGSGGDAIAPSFVNPPQSLSSTVQQLFSTVSSPVAPSSASSSASQGGLIRTPLEALRKHLQTEKALSKFAVISNAEALLKDVHAVLRARVSLNMSQWSTLLSNSRELFCRALEQDRRYAHDSPCPALWTLLNRSVYLQRVKGKGDEKADISASPSTSNSKEEPTEPLRLVVNPVPSSLIMFDLASVPVPSNNWSFGDSELTEDSVSSLGLRLGWQLIVNAPVPLRSAFPFSCSVSATMSESSPVAAAPTPSTDGKPPLAKPASKDKDKEKEKKASKGAAVTQMNQPTEETIASLGTQVRELVQWSRAYPFQCTLEALSKHEVNRFAQMEKDLGTLLTFASSATFFPSPLLSSPSTSVIQSTSASSAVDGNSSELGARKTSESSFYLPVNSAISPVVLWKEDLEERASRALVNVSECALSVPCYWGVNNSVLSNSNTSTISNINGSVNLALQVLSAPPDSAVRAFLRNCIDKSISQRRRIAKQRLFSTISDGDFTSTISSEVPSELNSGVTDSVKLSQALKSKLKTPFLPVKVPLSYIPHLPLPIADLVRVLPTIIRMHGGLPSLDACSMVAPAAAAASKDSRSKDEKKGRIVTNPASVSSDSSDVNIPAVGVDLSLSNALNNAISVFLAEASTTGASGPTNGMENTEIFTKREETILKNTTLEQASKILARLNKEADHSVEAAELSKSDSIVSLKNINGSTPVSAVNDSNFDQLLFSLDIISEPKAPGEIITDETVAKHSRDAFIAAKAKKAPLPYLPTSVFPLLASPMVFGNSIPTEPTAQAPEPASTPQSSLKSPGKNSKISPSSSAVPLPITTTNPYLSFKDEKIFKRYQRRTVAQMFSEFSENSNNSS